MFLKKNAIFVGSKSRKVIQKGLSKKDKIITDFMQQVFKAYTVTGRYLQSKLPIDSPTLQSLSALDPLARGHSVTMTHLHHLFDSFQHLLPIGEHFDVHAEVMQYNVDASIDKMEEENVIKFWVSKQMKDRYPQFTRIAAAALSCFHEQQLNRRSI